MSYCLPIIRYQKIVRTVLHVDTPVKALQIRSIVYSATKDDVNNEPLSTCSKPLMITNSAEVRVDSVSTTKFVVQLEMFSNENISEVELVWISFAIVSENGVDTNEAGCISVFDLWPKTKTK